MPLVPQRMHLGRCMLVEQWWKFAVKQQCASRCQADLQTDACGIVTLIMMASSPWGAACVTDVYQACNGSCGHPDGEESHGWRERREVKMQAYSARLPDQNVAARKMQLPACLGCCFQTVRPVECDAGRLDPCVGVSQPLL